MRAGKLGVVFSAVLGIALVSGGCATKKHVREAIAPVQQQVNDVDKRTADNKRMIGDLDRNLAVTDEKATDAGKRAGQAADAASAANGLATQANGMATQAGQKADAANSAAMQAQQGITRLDRSLQNLDNYKLVDTKQVFFRTGDSQLNQEAKTELDTTLMSVGNMRNYVIEIEGYADRRGGKALNLELSRKRADAVVRYLTVDHNVPLRDIRQLGIGSEFPNAVNKTASDMKTNRRVDVKIYALDITGGQGQSNSADRSAHPVQ